MPSINLDPNYFDHPKTFRLISRLGPGAEILPVRLWCYCAHYFGDDGRMVGMTPADIEGVIRWVGEPGAAVKAMIEVGFLEQDGDAYQPHDWGEYQGHIARYREKSRRMTAGRWPTPTSNPTRSPTSIDASILDVVPMQGRAGQGSTGQGKEKSGDKSPREAKREPVMPLSLSQSEAFVSAWGEWMAYRRESKLRALKAVSIEGQWKIMAEIGPERAVAAIKLSIAQGWQGIHEGKSNGKHTDKPSATAAERTASGWEQDRQLTL